MEFIKKETIKELSNPGVVSRQILNDENSNSTRVAITEVHLEPGAIQKRHTPPRQSRYGTQQAVKDRFYWLMMKLWIFQPETQFALPTVMFMVYSIIPMRNLYIFL